MKHLVFLFSLLAFAPAFAAHPTITQKSCAQGVHASPLQRLIEHVPQEERALLPARPEERPLMTTVARAFAAGSWDLPGIDLKCANCLEPVIRAAYSLVEKGTLTVDQLATLIVFWEAVLDFPYVLEQATIALPAVTADGKITEQAKSAFSEKGLLKSFWADKQTKTNKTLENEFAQQVAKLPPSERVFWDFRYPLSVVSQLWRRFPHGGKPYDAPYFSSLMDGLVMRTTMMNGLIWQDPGELSNCANMWIHISIPSTGILRIIQKMRFDDTALDPVPQLGIASEEAMIPDIRYGKRIVGLKYPGLKGLESADSMFCGHAPYTLHDWFHLIRGGMNVRGIVPMLATFWETANDATPRSYIVELRGKKYITQPLSKKDGWWPSLQSIIADAEPSKANDSLSNALKRVFPGRIGILPETEAIVGNAMGMDQLILFMAQNPALYEAHIGMTLDDLFMQMDVPYPSQEAQDALYPPSTGIFSYQEFYRAALKAIPVKP